MPAAHMHVPIAQAMAAPPLESFIWDLPVLEGLHGMQFTLPGAVQAHVQHDGAGFGVLVRAGGGGWVLVGAGSWW